MGHARPYELSDIVKAQIKKLAMKAMARGVEIVDSLSPTAEVAVDKSDISTVIETLLDHTILCSEPTSR
jgi:hypothetical protein